VAAGQRDPVAEHGPGGMEAAVLEAGWQLETDGRVVAKIDDTGERPVPSARRRRCRLGGAGDVSAEWTCGGQSCGGCGARRQEAATRERGHC
jgi:hypothetical protein